MTYVERKAREFDVNTIMDGDPLEALISSVILRNGRQRLHTEGPRVTKPGKVLGP